VGTAGLPSVYIFDTFFYPSLKTRGYKATRNLCPRNECIFDFDVCLMPLFLAERSHWAFAAIDMRSRAVSLMDSQHRDDEECLHIVINFLQEEDAAVNYQRRPWIKETPKDKPYQRNGYDCGVFVCLFAEHASRRTKAVFTEEDLRILCMRVRILLDIAASRLFFSSAYRSGKENEMPEMLQAKIVQSSQTRRILGSIN